MVEPIDHGLDEVAEALNLALKPIQPLHCTGVDRMHWSLHWCRVPILPRLRHASGVCPTMGARLDLSLSLQGMSPVRNGSWGNAQAPGDVGGFDPGLPQVDEAGLIGGGHEPHSLHIPRRLAIIMSALKTNRRWLRRASATSSAVK
jgi:hypothetical protein